MEISSISDDHLILQFMFLKSHTAVTVRAKFNLINSAFQNLSSLYFMSTVKVSTQYLVSQLVGGAASKEKLIGSVIPLSSLESLCESALEYKNVIGFLHVCKVDMPLTIHTDGTILENAAQLELPASSIWALLILSEVLGVHEAFNKCKGNLERMYKASAAAGKMLSPTVMGLLPVTEHSAVHANLSVYFSQFGTAQNDDRKAIATPPTPPIVTTVDARYVPSSSASLLENDHSRVAHHPRLDSDNVMHTNDSVARIQSLQSNEDAVPYRPTGTMRKRVPSHLPQHSHVQLTTASTHLYSYNAPYLSPPQPPTATAQSRTRTNPHEAHHTYDFNNIPASSQSVPPPNHSNASSSYRTSSNLLSPPQHGYSAPDTGNSSYFTPQTDRGYDTDSTGSASDDQLSPEYSTAYATPHRPQPNGHDHYQREKEESGDPNAFEHDLSTRHLHASHPINAHHRSSNNVVSSTPSGRAVSPAAFGSAAPRFPAPPSYSTPNGAAAPRMRRINSGHRQELDVGTDSTCSLSHSNGSESSPQTDFEFEYDSDHGQAQARTKRSASRIGHRLPGSSSNKLNSFIVQNSSTKPVLTAEDLRISRDIAKLRLQEAKVKEELEASRLRAEREMRESRLRALELKAAVARSTHHSPHRLSAVRVEENTRHNAAIGREFTFGTTPQQMRVPNSAANASSGSKSVTLSNEPGQKLQRNIADDGQRRAAQRVREAKKVQDRKKAQELAAEQMKEAQKWIVRDRKIQLFKEKQKGVLGFTDYYPSNTESTGTAASTTEGVSTQWLRGTVTDPTRRPVSAPRGYKSEQQRLSENKVHFRYSESTEETGGWIEEGEENDIVSSGHYSAEALAAVGLGKSPNCKVGADRAERSIPPAQLGMPPPSPVSIATASDLISVRVVRAWGLPECLGGTCAYVLVDWGAQGKAATHPVKHSTEPHYGATLQFKSPYRSIEAEERDLLLTHAPHEVHLLRAMSGTEYASSAGPMRVHIYNRNESVSDELVASGELDLHEIIVTTNAGEPSILYVTDNIGQPAGCVEFIIKHSLV